MDGGTPERETFLMCMSRKHVEYLERTNESDYQQGKISYETYIRFTDIVDRCRECDLCDNDKFGDILSECRVHFLRVFVSMKRDMEKAMLDKKLGEAAGVGPSLGPPPVPAMPPPAPVPAQAAPAAAPGVPEPEKQSA